MKKVLFPWGQEHDMNYANLNRVARIFYICIQTSKNMYHQYRILQTLKLY